jgi:hypothetical protein
LHRTIEWVDALPSPHTANKPSHTCNFIHPVEREARELNCIILARYERKQPQR